MLHHQIFRDPCPGAPRVIAAFSYRYDAHLVPDLLENIRPAVHGFVAWDDRAATAALSDEPARRSRLLSAARDLGADWLLVPDPDERFEQGIAEWFPGLLAGGDRTLWLFTLREMFGLAHYRTDGPWSAKSALRLFPLCAARIAGSALHGHWAEEGDGFRRRQSNINLYHLRMASPARRDLRRTLYASADPDRRYQPFGYDYMSDDRGMVLETLPAGRAFLPAFADDHGLWSPDPRLIGAPAPDPYEVRFARAAISARHRGHDAAHHVLADLYRDSKGDTDLLLVAARFAFEAGKLAEAVRLATEALADLPGDLYARHLRASALVAGGDPAAAAADLADLAKRLPHSALVADLLAEAARPTADFCDRDAAWRQLAPSGTAIHEGGRIAKSDLAIVVIGFRSQTGLMSAVTSLLDQDQPSEIVVVNSGGGPVARALAPVADRIRLITTDQPLRVGAARNLGVAASRAPFVAFLAGDCLAQPGWVSGRLARHRAGADAVSTAVLGEPDAGPVALAANRLHYSTRNPDADPRTVSHYGQSYARRLLRLCGAFPPGLPAGEDTVLNRRTSRFVAPVWAPEVATVHRDPADLTALLRDERQRGLRRAGLAPFRAFAAEAAPALAAAAVFDRRLSDAAALVSRDPTLSAARRRAVLATQWLVSQADRAGTVKGLARIARANDLHARSAEPAHSPDRALALARRAFALDPLDPAKAVRIGSLCHAKGDLAGARRALVAALALSPADAEAAAALTALVRQAEGAGAALRLAEGLALAAPGAARLWDLAAGLALAAGQTAQAVMLGQIALGCAVAAPAAHARLARLHAAAGNPLARAFRSHTSARLKAASARVEAPAAADPS